MGSTYKSTIYACYTGYVTQAIVNNLAPLFFVIFQTNFGLSFEQVGRLVLVNFLIQIVMDILSIKFMDRLGYRKAALFAHFMCVAGLVFLGILPNVLGDPYMGMMIAVAFYACGGGVLEVLVSPVVDGIPGTQKESAMSLLHSFYCWGQVAVVLVTTLLLAVFGQQYWPLIPVLWALVPLYNFIRFAKVPLPPTLPLEELIPIGKLLKSRIFMVFLVLMLCAGASELTMSQWSSLFAEKGLGLPKMVGDLLGPCLFAVFMGLGRTMYGIWGSRMKIKKALLITSALCVICYLTTVFAPWPALGLLGSALCGFSVSLMWPGTFSLGAGRFPAGGTAMFGLLAVFGDMGCSIGPWVTGYVSDLAKSDRLTFITGLIKTEGMDYTELGIKTGLLVATLFPLTMFIFLLLLHRKKDKMAKDSMP